MRTTRNTFSRFLDLTWRRKVSLSRTTRGANTAMKNTSKYSECCSGSKSELVSASSSMDTSVTAAPH